jgi:processive 1,2-diacylglycerol beta-glucosyltransferase
LEFGVDEEKIKVTGFPVRQRFYRETMRSFRKENGLHFLIMSGGEGVGNMNLIAENLLSNFNCSVTIVAGRNEKLKEQLESSLSGKFADRVEVLGFVKNIQDYMFAADVAITRGSPNVMFEAVASNLPLVITGALPGQEKDNPLFAENNNLGVICKEASHINLVVDRLLANDGEKLKEIINSQREFVNKNAAHDILKFLGEIETKDYYVPVRKLSIAYVANRLKRSI